jgi:O-antigen/teichoic acid export membrane protein
MSNATLKKNIGANFAGSIWQAIMGLVFVPLYIKFIGIESYGLIGFFTTLQIIFGLLDVGLGSTLTREMARLSALTQREREMRNLVRTLEVIYWGVAIFVGVLVVLLSPAIAEHWIKPGELSTEVIQQSILIMGLVMVFQMPGGFYSGGLMGLQKQVLLNIINSGVNTLRGAGAVLVLWLVSPTIYAFLLWQLFVNILNAVLLVFFLWRNLPECEGRSEFQKNLLSGIWRFAAGMSGTAVFSVILTQIDKVILSKILPLEMFGYYMLASIIAMSLGRIFTPVFFSIYPKFTQLVSINDIDELKLLYHRICQFFAVLILPAAIVIAFFSYEVILLWTQNPITADKTHLIVSIMICGTALNGLTNPAYALQLAFGWTKLSFYKNVIAVIVLVPFIVYATKLYGVIGAASVWLLLNLGFVFIEIPIMHRKLLINEKWQWYLKDVCIPLMTCIFVAGIGRLLTTEPMSKYMMFLYLVVISSITLGLTAFSTSVTRIWIFKYLLKLKFAHDGKE